MPKRGRALEEKRGWGVYSGNCKGQQKVCCEGGKPAKGGGARCGD